MNILPQFVRDLYIGGMGSQLQRSADLFMSQRDALVELMRRRKNSQLKRKVVASLNPQGQALLAHFEQPSAVLFRQVASPTQETLRFLRIARYMGLQAIILEYYGDKFVSAGNPFKRALGKMPIYEQTATDGRDIVHFRTIVDFNSYVGKPLSAVQCANGKQLIKFHHELMKKITDFNTEKFCVDATPWFKANGASAFGYYEQFLTLFVRNAILFEEVLPTESEERFANQVIIPAFTKVKEKFALRPLIVELIPKNKARRIYWDSYPKEVEKYI